MLESSFTGVLRTVFIIIGVITVLRLIVRVMKARREQEELNSLKQREEEIKQAQENAGKTKALENSKTTSLQNVEDVDFEELKD